MQKKIVVNSKEIFLLKPLTAANYESNTVLTDSSWEYVDLWLQRQRGDKFREALFFWQQAKNFYNASECLPQNSKPLTAYYCCMNAAKALLCINGVDVNNISHGITQSRQNQSISNSLENAQVIFTGSGVLNNLSRYLGENVNKSTYTIKDLLYNIPCIHRTFSITYSGSAELFIPISKLHFMREDTTSKAWIQFVVDSRYANRTALRNLPGSYRRTNFDSNDGYYVRKENSRFTWDIHAHKHERLDNLSAYHKKVRKELFYIYGDSKLWYIKKDLPNNPHIIARSSLTLIFAVMHWMSELVRYNPQKFENYMRTKQNWLLHEFIEKALYQFVDEMSCEITHQEIMPTGYRK